MLVGKWNFAGDASDDDKLADMVGFWKNLVLQPSNNLPVLTEKGLQLRKGQYAIADPEASSFGTEIKEKTLISWIILDTVTNDPNKKPAGSALTLDSKTGDLFDGIVFGEAGDNTWSAGSNNLSRTESAGVETAMGETIKMMLTYHTLDTGKGQIKIYRNDELQHTYEVASQATWEHSNMEVLFGARHILANGTVRGYLNATIVGAEIRSEALGMLKLVEEGQVGTGSGVSAGGSGSTPIQLTPKNQTYVEILFDASDSMNSAPSSDATTKKITVAQNVLKEVINSLPNIQVGLTAFGYPTTEDPSNCNTQQLVPMGELTNVKNNLIDTINNKLKKGVGSTPIAGAINTAKNHFPPNAVGSKMILLMTDGDQTCHDQGTPLQAIQTLRQESNFEVRTNIIGIDITSASNREKFGRWAEEGGGKYYDATDADQFKAQVKEALSLKYTITDLSNGNQLDFSKDCYVGGPSIPLSPGKYLVKLGEDKQKIRVEVLPGEETRIVIDRTS
jgi:hypothetical protein